MEKKIKPYFLATVFNMEAKIEKFFISCNAALPMVETISGYKLLKTFWTYEEAEAWLN